MIASVRGEVLDIALDHVVIEAAGVGYKIMATPSTLATLHRGSIELSNGPLGGLRATLTVSAAGDQGGPGAPAE